MTTALILCADRAPSPVPDSFKGVDFIIAIDELCTRPKALPAAIGDAATVVLGLCGDEYVLGQVQSQLRAAGVDPLGVPIIDLSAIVDDGQLAIDVAGVAARARTFGGSGPEHAKMVIPPKMSRRALISASIPAYQAAPAIDHEVCAADSGCRACVEVCPQDALSWAGGQIRYDKVDCQPCGRCVTTCPTGATVNPAVTASMVMAQVEGIVAAGGDLITYCCARGFAPRGSGHVVDVPCTGMVTPSWLLAPLVRGAAAVSALPCAATGCPLGNDELVLAVVDYCNELLEALGDNEIRVAVGPMESRPAPLPLRDLDNPLGPHGGAEMALVLADVLGTAEAVIEHSAASSGMVAIDPKACTGCTQCARTCPTDALSLEQGLQGSLAINFDAALCTACGQCVPRCPELERGAIAMTPMTDLAAIGSSPRPLYEGTAELCERCGSPIASTEVMDRIGELLGSDHAATMSVVSTLCVNCRGRG